MSKANDVIQAMSEKDAKRLWHKVNIGYPHECWEWKGCKTKYGHGVFSIRHTWCLTHRVAFFIMNGHLPTLVMHDCENPSCCNPAHLLAGTVKENGNYPGCVAKLKARTGPLASMYGKYGKENPRFGMKHSAETKRQISEFAKRRERVKGRWV